jgi:protein-S-isoprenylcysteine O-methyltransferase Ste14
MMIQDIPGAILAATIWTYWFGVGLMVFRVHRKSRRLGGLVPEQSVERLMWLIWVPLVTAWLMLPYLALVRRSPWLHTPAFALADPAYVGLRWVAAAVALLCLLLTAWCWARMDADWSMAVSEQTRGELISDGLFSRVRHPIYALSVTLMLCSAVIVATPPMLAIAAIHIVLMHLKARNEERHMLKMHGDAYALYLRRTGRFVPRLGAPAA